MQQSPRRPEATLQIELVGPRSAAAMRARLDERMNICVRDSLRPVALVVSGVYLLLAGIFSLTAPDHTALLLSLLASTTAGACLLIWQVVGEDRIAPRYAHPAAASILGLVLLNLLLHLNLVNGPHDTSSISLFIVGSGCLILSVRWLIGTLAITNILSAIVASYSVLPVDWFEFLFIQAAATALSLCIFALRLRTFSRLELARIRDTQQRNDLEKALRQVRNSEGRFRMLSESVPIGIFQFDAGGNCTYTNSMWKSITGWSAGGNRKRPWFDAIHPSDRERVEKAWFAGWRNERGLSGIFRLNDQEGRQRWAELRISANKTDAATTNYVGALEDITERKRAEEELKLYAEDLKAAKEIQERNTARLANVVEELEVAKRRAEVSTRSKSEFLANMSHEIRTPMTAILGFTDLLIERADRDSDETESLETIKRNGEYLLQILNDILDISRIEAGKLRIERLPCSPQRLLEEVKSLMMVRASAKKLVLEVLFEGPMPETIETDPMRYRQILINMVANAIKFTQKGSIKVVARMIDGYQPPHDPDSHVPPPKPGYGFRVDVIDTGIGMSTDQTERLFQPFTQVDNSTSRQFGGAGLGLAISKRLADVLGGEILVESEIGKGSTFCITIPAGSEDRIRIVGGKIKPSEPAATPPPPAVVLPPGCRVLLAEDGPDNQRLITFLLQKGGAEVAVAVNGKIACELALEAWRDEQPFDVILMDMQMPVLDGYGATRQLRELGYVKPIIALTAHAMQGDREKCIAAGCDDYAAKPINRDFLFTTIRRQLTQHQLT